MKKILISLFIILLLPCAFSETQQEAYKNDYLYSAAYFDYLIECAEIERDKQTEEQKQNNNNEQLDEITTNLEEDEIELIQEPFKLSIQTNSNVAPFNQAFQKIDTKTIIPVGSNFSFIQDMSKKRNKYNSDDYKILAGVEYNPNSFFKINSGLETNFSGLDQIPTSRKLYFTPSFSIMDKISLSFHNKINAYTRSVDHDIGLTISPLKSKAFDFGVYAGMTRKQSGAISRSINFSTNFYLF